MVKSRGIYSFVIPMEIQGSLPKLVSVPKNIIETQRNEKIGINVVFIGFLSFKTLSVISVGFFY
jgi:hypothetical protein